MRIKKVITILTSLTLCEPILANVDGIVPTKAKLGLHR
jgi:hypothetical protein